MERFLVEKNKERYFDLKYEAEKGGDFNIYIGKGKPYPLYARSGEIFPIESVKIIIDKGDGLRIIEDFFASDDKANDVNFSVVLEKFRKMVFAHDTEGVHSFGFERNYTELEHILICAKTKYFITMIFASAGIKKINVYERVIDNDDATTSMINMLFNEFAEKAEYERGDDFEFAF